MSYIGNLDHILSVCGKERNISNALLLHVYLSSSGLEATRPFGNNLLCMFVDLQHMQIAEQIFDKLVYQDDQAWNSLISGYTKAGKSEHAFTLYERMLKDQNAQPNEHTYMAVLKACGKLKSLEKGVEAHKNLEKTNILLSNVFVGSALVDMYAKCGYLEKAHEVFSGLPVRNVVSWTALISAYVEHGDADIALQLFEQMQLESVSPNAVTFICTLKACSLIKYIEKGFEIHSEIERLGLLDFSTVGNALVDMYAKGGLMFLSREVFDQLRVQNVISWTSLIVGYCEHGQGEEALRCFDQMQLTGISPNLVTFVCCLKACSSKENVFKGQEIHVQIERQRLFEKALVANALIDMYVKCGYFAIAEELFDKHLTRDVVSWTTLIAGYAARGDALRPFVLFKRMLEDGITPNIITLVCFLKACASAQNLFMGKLIHVAIEMLGLLERDNVGYTLVDMYAKCGRMSMSQEVFDQLLCRDAALWNALISGYMDEEQSKKVLECFEQMQLEGVSPDTTTYLYVLKACLNIGSIETVKDIHGEIERQGFLKDVGVCNTLIYIHVKCGSFEVAQQLFDKIPSRDVATWTSLIAGYTENENAQMAILCFECMQVEGVLPNARTLAYILKACVSMNDIDKGKEVHAEIERQGQLETNIVLGNNLMYLYSQCGWLDVSRQLFNCFSTEDVISWTAIIMGYTDHGAGEEAIKVFEQMQLAGVLPDTVTFLCALRACANIIDVDKGREIHSKILCWRMMEKDIVLGSTLVHMYAKCGFVDLAQEAFDEIPERDDILWTTLIAGYTDNGHSEKALKCFEQLQVEGVSPNAETYIYVLKACGNAGAIEKGHKIHEDIEKQGLLDTNDFIGSCLIDMYCKCGNTIFAKKVFDKLPVKSVTLWTAIIVGYMLHDDSEEALKLFEEMQQHGFSPNAVTCFSILRACANIGAMDKGQEIHAEIERQGLQNVDPVIGNSLVDMYAKCGSLEIAHAVFDKLPIHDVVTWTALLAGYAELGHGEDVFDVFDKMVQDGVKPNPVTFVIILSACSRMGLSSKGQMYLEAMTRDYNIIPSIEHVTWLVDVIGRVGQIDEAIGMIKKLPSCPNLVTWHTLLTACQISGNVHLGKEVFEEALKSIKLGYGTS